ncbi:porin [Roseixanthobacter glucoisosaccharinicivorans]|uniref:porin n=1 Tax=Roseixanthobacter glucoisosaccharinicivorans TaxID=3119923 RepID=UPI00372CC90E
MGLPFAHISPVHRTGAAARALRGRLALAALVGTLGAGGALAGESAKSGTASGTASGANPCAQFGAGFQRAPGSDTCIKVGGAVRVDAGSGNTAGNAPNPGSSNTTTTGNSGPAVDPWKPAR